MITTVWNLPTQMTSFFDISFLLNDQAEYVLLQDGLAVRIEVLGGATVDLSGLTEVSLWSQYFKFHLKKSVALRLRQELTLLNDEAKCGQFVSSFDTNIITEVKFSNDFSVSPSKLCTQVTTRRALLNEDFASLVFKDGVEEVTAQGSQQTYLQPSTYMVSKEATANC
jgi:hypothetical protein